MSKGQDRRQTIFDKYVSNRNLLIDNGLINGERNIYLCPLCMKPHESINEVDPLTLEDAPPKSLGGRANVLTCKSCNNTAGHEIDFHLAERLQELDSASFLPNTETRIKIRIGEEVLNGTISIDEEGNMSIFHSKKNNHPIKLETNMVGLKPGDKVNLSFLKTRVIPDKLEYALLKTAYILAFEKLGNSIIFDNCFNIVRDQLQNPDQRIYPEKFWMKPNYPEEMVGVFFVCNNGLESLLVLFNLNAGNSIKKFGVTLPCPVNDVNDALDRIWQKLETEKGFDLNLYPLQQNDTLYLDDIEEIKEMFKWIEDRKCN